MCGIIGSVARCDEKSIVPNIISGLNCLGSRGYDGAGIVIQNKGKFSLFKREGKLQNLLDSLNPEIFGTVGIAHNRWATHGGATDTNAHPHLSNDNSIAVVHNGIIENYQQLRTMLEKRGFYFLSETDTEVIPNLIQLAIAEGARSLLKAVIDIIPQLDGEYAFLVMSEKYPDEVVATTYERPLVLGTSETNFSIASSEIALIGIADEVLVMEDYEISSITRNEIMTYKKSDRSQKWQKVEKLFRPTEATASDISKGDFSTYLESEIWQQPKIVSQALLGRILNGNDVQIAGLESKTLEKLKSVQNITAVACGTSYHTLLVAKLYFEKLAKIPLNVELASEFQDREPLVSSDSFLVAVSQSGETADTVRALDYAAKAGAYTLAVTNCMNSQLVNKAGASINVQAGPEISVASTKAYTAQVVTLLLLATKVGILKGTLTTEKVREIFSALQKLPEQIEQILQLTPRVQELAKTYRSAQRVVIIGKGYAVPVAYEAALKIQEVAYQDSFGFASGELKHGPLALITGGVPVFAIALNGLASQRVVSNAEEVRARNGEVIALVTSGSEEERLFANKAKYIFALPKAIEEMTPILSVIIMQLMALYLGLERGNDVDNPRNLAKSVTVS